ncbi:hypothetical protein PSEUDO9AG_40404 [Pseudomonas sp. 9Ag]|nr:hypothetical protein PSEUDO9AG_40404 [Pseudomonas sp. 9Ag]
MAVVQLLALCAIPRRLAGDSIPNRAGELSRCQSAYADGKPASCGYPLRAALVHNPD